MKSDKFIPGVTRISYGGALIGQEEKDAINAVIDSQGGRRWTIGEESESFERELAEVAGVNGAVVVNSGSSALLVAIAALKLPYGSKVIIPALNFPTAYSAILQNGLIPVVVDCNLQDLNINMAEVTKALILHPEIKAVVAIHIAGNMVDLPLLRNIVGDRIIISDNCDGLGSTLNGKYIDSYADVSCVSFHAAHIITMGEGGAILSDNEEILTRARKIREWGRASGSDKITEHPGFPADYRERYVFEEMGYNLKPLELQCAMGRVQLKKLEQFKQSRGENYKKLYDIFDRYVHFLPISGDTGSCWFSFPFLCVSIPRTKVMSYFERNNIECRTIFSGNILIHPAYKNKPHVKIGNLENSTYVMHEGMFISTHPSIGQAQIDFIAQVVKEVVR